MSVPRPGPRRARPGAPDAAFDVWLQRGLHAMYDDVANEPIPEELLRLIESDRFSPPSDNNQSGSPEPRLGPSDDDKDGTGDGDVEK